MNVLDLFCGCGGAGLGIKQAGHKIKYAIDSWKGCRETHENNFPETEFILSDIQDLDPLDFKDVDFIWGSPPCVEFSSANRNGDPKKGMKLVNEFIRWVKIIRPKYFIMENVPQIRTYLDRKDFLVVNIFNSANYGVPQIRKRCFAGFYSIPYHTHSRVPTKTLSGEILPKWITVGDVINDIPNEAVLSDSRSPKKAKANSPFYKPDRPGRVVATHPHSILLKDPRSKKFRKTHPALTKDLPSRSVTGKNDNLVVEIPNHICFDNLKEFNYEMSNREIDKNKPSPTVMPKFRINQKIKSKKMYRRLTVRECARLQSFPDNFIFYGSLSSQYKMVGNAVPPLMAYHLTKGLK